MKGTTLSGALTLLLASEVANADPAIEVVELKAQPALVTTIKARPKDLEGALGGAYFSLVATTQRRGLAVDGPPFARYLSHGNEKDPTIVVEAGLPVRGTPKEPLSGDVRFIVLPAGPAVTYVHLGRHDTLLDAHAKVDAWLTTEKRAPSGSRWEIYLTTPLTTPDPNAQRTQIVVPIAK